MQAAVTAQQAVSRHLPDTSLTRPRRCAEHYVDDLEELLDDAILHDFNVEAQDGSPRQVRILEGVRGEGWKRVKRAAQWGGSQLLGALESTALRGEGWWRARA